MILIEILEGDLLEGIEASAREKGIEYAAIVTLIGAVDSFTISTMPADDATKDIVTDYGLPAEMTATGEIVEGKPHIHAVMAVEGDRAISGHVHRARIGTHFARAYVMPTTRPGRSGVGPATEPFRTLRVSTHHRPAAGGCSRGPLAGVPGAAADSSASSRVRASGI